MNFRQYVFALKAKIGHAMPTKQSIAAGLSVSIHDVTAMMHEVAQPTPVQLAAMAEILARPPYPGYVTVSTMAKHRGCTRQYVHRFIKSGTLPQPETINNVAVWRGEEYRHIWEGVYHESTAAQ